MLRDHGVGQEKPSDCKSDLSFLEGRESLLALPWLDSRVDGDRRLSPESGRDLTCRLPAVLLHEECPRTNLWCSGIWNPVRSFGRLRADK